jgi:uncharacterized alpha-E superfamily protein
MLSRVADNLYWMSRYLERAEHAARIEGVHLNLMLEHEPASQDRRWQRVLAALGCADAVEGDAFAAAQTFALNQIVHSIAEARENARQVREQISSEMWEQINRLFHEVRRLDVLNLSNSSPHEFLSSIREGIHLFQGITNSTMTHGEGWRFLELGRYLERARATCVLVGAHFREFPAPPDGDTGTGEHLEWVGLLRTCTAFEAFCKAYTADTRPDRVAEFLILHPRFPHSIRFSADRIASSLHAIGEISSARDRYEADRLAGRLRATIDFAQIDEILSTGLQAFLDAILKQCALVHESLCETYIEYPIEAALAG